jgi:hypothetical protein
MVMAKVQIKPAAITRAGYEYQDLAGIEVLIRQYRDPELYAWVLLEADDTNYRALDDVVAARKDGSYEFLQVKFTVDPDRYELDWDWLLAKTKNGTSMLEKWAKSLARVAAMGPIHSAGLKTNRIPSAEFAKCLKGTRVDLDLLQKEIRESVEGACGGAADAKAFFRAFDFLGGLPDLDGYENYLRDQLVPTDTDALGWLAFRHNVRRWAIYQNQPEPDGRILREHVVQLITKRRPQPIRQDFIVPDGYSPPNEAFDKIHSRAHCEGRQSDHDPLGNARTREEHLPQLSDAGASKGRGGRHATPLLSVGRGLEFQPHLFHPDFDLADGSALCAPS